ncbi:unnamed protein product [Bursaphelenchus xylophilus]|uniref:Complex III subunit 9 n=1 Tax=Bursaphelenchus xylophilus TaxID=6326 RepID=A0A1I7S5X2_BURXY|nr:unnamed protein product [Bursaphelenchus xylophilus]CAG9082582.1 unnamed protein product [Bursaphelenchus xylophilus]
MGVFGTFYNVAGKRFSTLLLTAAGGVFVLDLVLNRGTEAFWESNNQGKLWKHIKPKILAQQQEESQ